jgi:hypothetical protein
MSRAKNLANFQTTITDGTTSVATSFVTNGSAKVFSKTSADGTSITKSFNVSSLVDTNTGQQTININSNMSDGDYIVQVGKHTSSVNAEWVQSTAVGSFIMYNYNGSSYVDSIMFSSVDGDLA